MSKVDAAQVEQARAVLLQYGKQTMDSMWGEGTGDKPFAAATEFTRPGLEYTIRNAFEGIWSGPGLEPKQRSLVVISILAATGKLNQLKVHVRYGLVNGLSEEEIRETILHVMGYCGFPTALDATGAAVEAIEAFKKEKESK